MSEELGSIISEATEGLMIKLVTFPWGKFY